MKRIRAYGTFLLCSVIVLLIISACTFLLPQQSGTVSSVSIDTLPSFSGKPYVILNNNTPEFSADEITTQSFEFYSELDAFNRCGYVMACIGRDLMPTEERGSIGQIKPTGWQTVKYDFVDGKYLYNRCHLIGYQLTGENANECNLITGTRFLNVEGMLPFENMVADYVKETGNHVMYRVTPIFYENEQVARGVQMEAVSVEDDGEGIAFNVFAYNCQPGVTIDYNTGESVENAMQASGPTQTSQTENEYILNTNSKKFHASSCGQGQAAKEENKQYYIGNRDDLIADGYTPAGCCDP